MKAGLSLPQITGGMGGETPRGADIITLARLAEELGFDSVWLIDHFCIEPYADMVAHGESPPDSYKGVKIGAWECWSLASAVAAATERVEIGTQVSNTGYRNPALLARIADTVDEISDGRVILGLGAGYFQSEYTAFGYPWDRRVGRFEEALQIIRGLTRGEKVTFDGEFYQTKDAELIPKGPRPKGPPVLIGTVRGGPRMRRLVAQYADNWNCYLGFGDSRPHAYEEPLKTQLESCEKHGRDPSSLELSVTLRVSVGEAKLPTSSQPGSVGYATPLTGSPSEIAEQLNRYAELNVQHVIVVLNPNTGESIEAFAPVLESL